MLCICLVIEYYNNNLKNWRAREGHAGGGQETIIQFVVALSLVEKEWLLDVIIQSKRQCGGKIGGSYTGYT